MSWIALKWLRPDRREWWSRLGPARHHLACIVLHEAIRAEAAVGTPVAVYTVDQLVNLTGTSRSGVARNLTSLLQAGFCRVDSRRGRGARLVIAVVDPDRSGEFAEQFTGDFSAPVFGVESRSLDSPPDPGGEFPGDIPGDFPGPDILDLDQGSVRIPDPRSQTSGRTQTSREKTMGPTGPNVIEADLVPRGGQLDALMLMAEASSAKAKRQRQTRIDVDKIPDRAWAAADYMRGEILKQNPTAWISRQPWSGAKEGVRAKWADEFRLIHERDRRSWDDIARFTHRAFNTPPGGSQFVVESPSSLREKWDRIHLARQRDAQQRQQQQRGPGVPDTRPPPQLKRWDAPWPDDNEGDQRS